MTISLGSAMASLALALGLGLGGCAEKPQAASGKKADAQAYEGTVAADAAFVATGWKAGDQTSWTQQMRSRAQGQNEYTRTDPK